MAVLLYLNPQLLRGNLFPTAITTTSEFSTRSSVSRPFTAWEEASFIHGSCNGLDLEVEYVKGNGNGFVQPG